MCYLTSSQLQVLISYFLVDTLQEDRENNILMTLYHTIGIKVYLYIVGGGVLSVTNCQILPVKKTREACNGYHR